MRSIAVGVVLAGGFARADDLATTPVRPGYEDHGHALDWEGRNAWERAGFELDATYVFETFAAPQLEDAFLVAGLFALEFDVDLEHLVSHRLGAAHVAGFAIHGDSPTTELMDVYGISGNTAPRDVRLFEAWYEQPIGALSLRAGLLAADQEFVLAEQSSTLVNATFGITSQFAYNLVGPVYPVATPGLSGRLELAAVTVRAALYDGSQSNAHGIPTALGPESLGIGEVTLAGVLKLGAWHDTEDGTAYYVVGDAQLDRRLGAFARVGVHPGAPVDTYIDAGVRIGPGPLRPDDVFSVGLAFATTDDGIQTLIEATYEAAFGWLTVQPDLQLLMMHGRTIAIVATRITVAF